LASFIILVAGRVLLCMSPWAAEHAVALTGVLAALTVMAIGEGVLQTANYSGLKQYSDEKTSAVGFGLNYAIFNLGIVAVGFLSPVIRTRVDALVASRTAGEPMGASPLAWL